MAKGDDLLIEVHGSDMTPEMQKQAKELCVQAVKSGGAESKMATYVKKHMDELFPEVKWHCIVGQTYASYFTHDPGSFMNVRIGDEIIVIFSA